jgi:hypothetical protein
VLLIGLASSWVIVLHEFDGVLVEIEARLILQTCRYLSERQGASEQGLLEERLA